jgi:3-hydroxyacyl-CoA dehydrogenase
MSQRFVADAAALQGVALERATRHLASAEGAVADVPGISATDQPRGIGSCGIVGSGTMGGGIAMAFANVDIPVVLLDLDQAALDRGLAVIRRNYDASVKRGRMTPAEVQKRMALITGSTSYMDLAAVDLAIEAVFEDMDLKQRIFTQLDRVLKPGAILATNTSTLDINLIAAITQRPQDVIGLHFFSPAHVMRLLEIVRTDTTGQDVIATAFALAKQLRKVGVLSKVCFGFIGNRMMDPYAREAERLVLEGATPAQVDAALERFGMAMGILAVFDMAGVDVGVRVRRANPGRQPKDDPTFYRASQVLFDQGWLGQKSGKGYYRYEAGSRERLPHDEALSLLHLEGRKLGIARDQPISSEEIVERCIYSMINEGARILEEGVALRPGDIDVVYTSGYGFPRQRGGPMFFADEIGLDVVLAGLQKYAGHGNAADWEPAGLLKALAQSGSTFTAWAEGRLRK